MEDMCDEKRNFGDICGMSCISAAKTDRSRFPDILHITSHLQKQPKTAEVCWLTFKLLRLTQNLTPCHFSFILRIRESLYNEAEGEPAAQ